MAKQKDCVKKCRACKGNVVTKDKIHIAYDNELSLLIEEFRLARSNWLASKKDNKTINETNDADLKESARRKLRHFKTLRPLPYFTLKSNLSYTKVLKLEEKERRKRERVCAREVIKNKETEEFYKEYLKLMKEKDKIQYEKQEDKKQYEKQKEEKSITKEGEKKEKKQGPSKKAIENLKAAKFGGGIVESLKCNDGKEVTVVIKGFCLCDKNNVRKFKLDKIRDDYEKFEQSRQQPEEREVRTHQTDSLILHRKRQSFFKREEEEYEPPVLNEKSGKRVLFKRQEKTEKNQQKSNGLYENNQRERGLDDVKIEKKRIENEERKEAEKRIENDKNEREKKLDNQKKSENEDDKRKKYEGSKVKERPLKDDSPASLVTLYKNRSPNLSESGLTEEQSAKIKNIKNKNN